MVEEFARLAHHGYDSTRGTEVVNECLAESQRRIREYGDEHRAAGDPDWYAGTTVVAALLCEDEEGPKWLLANLGDSRIYRVHEDALDQVSVDHSVVQELIDAGEIDAEAAAVHPERHVITRALGGPVLREPDFFLLPLSVRLAGDALLRRRHRDDRRRRDRGDPRRERRPARRRRPDRGRGGRTPEGRTTRPPSWSMWWDWRSPGSRTTRGPRR